MGSEMNILEVSPMGGKMSSPAGEFQKKRGFVHDNH